MKDWTKGTTRASIKKPPQLSRTARRKARIAASLALMDALLRNSEELGVYGTVRKEEALDVLEEAGL